jgi:hypothetical protein
MKIQNTYEDLSSSEADFIIDLYDASLKIHNEGRIVTLVGLGHELNVRPSELSDYLPIIVQIVSKIEEEQVR